VLAAEFKCLERDDRQMSMSAYQPRFRWDNTEGYTEEQLADLNRLYEARLATYSAQDRCEKSVRDYVAERAQVEFDALNRL
jgi:hypothetical protein